MLHDTTSCLRVLTVGFSTSDPNMPQVGSPFISEQFKLGPWLAIRFRCAIPSSSWWYPPGAHPRSLRPAIVEAVEHVREQWSFEVVEYDNAANDDESDHDRL